LLRLDYTLSFSLKNRATGVLHRDLWRRLIFLSAGRIPGHRPITLLLTCKKGRAVGLGYYPLQRLAAYIDAGIYGSAPWEFSTPSSGYHATAPRFILADSLFSCQFIKNSRASVPYLRITAGALGVFILEENMTPAYDGVRRAGLPLTPLAGTFIGNTQRYTFSPPPDYISRWAGVLLR